MPGPSWRQTAQWTATTLLFAAVVALAVWRLDDSDTWWHLAAGRYIVAHGTVPTHDPFSYTASARPWIDLQWLFQLGLLAVYTVGGVPALILATAAAAVVIFAILHRVVRGAGPFAATLTLTLTLLVLYERFMVRPETLSFVCVVSALALLEAYPANGRWIWALVPLQALWVNVHALFVTGLVLLAAYAIGRTLMALLPGASATDRQAARRLWLVAGTATAVSLVNPYGVTGAVFPLKLLTRFTTDRALYGVIGEFGSPFTTALTPSVRAYAVVIALSTLGILLCWRAWRLDRLCAWTAFLVLSLLARRNMGLFALVAAPIVADGLAAMGTAVAAQPRVRPVAARLAGWAQWLLAGALALLLFLVVTNRFYWSFGDRREFGLGVSSIDFPVGAVDFLNRADVTGNIFNDLTVGGYLIWRGFPARKVFIDGRLEVYDERFFARYLRALNEPAAFDALADEYAVTHVLLFHAWPNRRVLIHHLATSAQWAPVYFDRNAIVFVRNRPEYVRAAEIGAAAIRRELARNAAGDDAPSPRPGSWWRTLVWPVHAPHADVQRGNLLLLLGRPVDAARDFEAALALHPTFLEARVGLGYARWDAGAHDAARSEWQRILASDPDCASAREALALAATYGP